MRFRSCPLPRVPPRLLPLDREWCVAVASVDVALSHVTPHEDHQRKEGSWSDVCRLLRKGALNELRLEWMLQGGWPCPDQVGEGRYHAEGVHEVGQMLDQLIDDGSLDGED